MWSGTQTNPTDKAERDKRHSPEVKQSQIQALCLSTVHVLFSGFFFLFKRTHCILWWIHILKQTITFSSVDFQQCHHAVQWSVTTVRCPNSLTKYHLKLSEFSVCSAVCSVLTAGLVRWPSALHFALFEVAFYAICQSQLMGHRCSKVVWTLSPAVKPRF